jgi:hypothetical protein
MTPAKTYRVVDLPAIEDSPRGRWANLAAAIAALPSGKAIECDIKALGKSSASEVTGCLCSPAKKLGIKIRQRKIGDKLYLFLREPGERAA